MGKRQVERCLVAVRPRAGKIRICDRPGRVERDGVWYCHFHDPVERKVNDIQRAKESATEWRREEAKRNFENSEHERQIQVQLSLWVCAQNLREVLQGEELTDKWKESARRYLEPLMDVLRRHNF